LRFSVSQQGKIIVDERAGLVTSSIATVTLALLFPAEYDWSGTRGIVQAGDDAPTDAHVESTPTGEMIKSQIPKQDPQTRDYVDVSVQPAEVDLALQDEDEVDSRHLDRDELQRVFIKASWISGTMAVIITFVCQFRNR
jgi:urea-proton symporter